MNGITEKTLRDAVADALERGLPEDDADTFAEMPLLRRLVRHWWKMLWING